MLSYNPHHGWVALLLMAFADDAVTFLQKMIEFEVILICSAASKL